MVEGFNWLEYHGQKLHLNWDQIKEGAHSGCYIYSQLQNLIHGSEDPQNYAVSNYTFDTFIVFLEVGR
jgi:hypothetical protein